MKLLISLFILSVPFYSIGVFILDKYISISHVFAVLVASMIVVFLAENKLKKSEFSWVKYFFYFLLVAMLGLMLSPYAPASYFKGIIQILGISIMLCMVIVVVKYVKAYPPRLIQLIRLMLFGVGLMAVVGVAQFFIFNFTPFSSLMMFDFLNTFSDGSVWRNPGYIGSIHRVNSFASEPTAMARYLCLGLGFALIRLGFAGKVAQSQLVTFVPLWVALSIVLAMLISLSINAYLLFIVVAVALVILPKKISARMVLRLVRALAIVLVTLVAAAYTTEGAFLSKLTTVALVFDSSSVDTSDNGQLSGLAVASNIEVALKSLEASPLLAGGIGSHSLSYDVYAPWYVGHISSLDGLNADDAASLLYRLISETGIVGASLFLFALGNIIYRARKLILSPNTEPRNKTIAAALAASCVGMFEIYLSRTGHYYDPVFWVLIALTIAVGQKLIVKKVSI